MIPSGVRSSEYPTGSLYARPRSSRFSSLMIVTQSGRIWISSASVPSAGTALRRYAFPAAVPPSCSSRARSSPAVAFGHGYSSKLRPIFPNKRLSTVDCSVNRASENRAWRAAAHPNTTPFARNASRAVRMTAASAASFPRPDGS